MSTMPNVGEKAPEFVLKNQDGEEIKLKDFLGKQNVVLYFYPKDDTPGCTKEACNFRDHLPDFTALDASILGVSVDSVHSHKKFVEKYQLPFQLLSDAEKSVSKAYGVLNEKGNAKRVTFIIDKQGIIRQVFPNVKVDGHWEEVRRSLEALNVSV
jgi:peroxiredoxin Q/BCP